MADIFQEVDEEVRKEKATEWWRRYGAYLIALAVALVLAVGGYKAWKSYDEGQRGDASDAFAAATMLAQSDDSEAALAAYGELSAEGEGGYGLLASFEQARLLAAEGKTEDAIAIWDRIAASSDVGKGFKGIATLLSVLHQLGTADAASLRARLDPLAATGPFRAGATELLAAVELREGNSSEARLLYGQIADDVTAPQGLRARAAQMLAALPE